VSAWWIASAPAYRLQAWRPRAHLVHLGYDTFGRAAETRALKVIIEA
jgi:hypothetical protein